MAGATANYLYYWHCKEQIAEIKKSRWLNHTAQDAALKEAGGNKAEAARILGVQRRLLYQKLAELDLS